MTRKQPSKASDARVVSRHPVLSESLRLAIGHPLPPARGRMAVFSMGRIETRPGAFFDWTIHEGLWEIEVVERGEFELGVDGSSGLARSGDVLLYPAGTPHAMWNRSPQTGSSLVIHFEVNDVPLVERNPLFRLKPGRPLCRFGPNEMLWFEQLFHQVWWEETTRLRGYESAEDALLRLIFLGLERHLAATGNEMVLSRLPAGDVMRFLGCVRDALGQPEPLRVASQQMGVNYDSMRHRFKREVGMSPKQYVMHLRIQQAKHLLLTTRLSIKEIADRLGYADGRHFTAVFTRKVGFAPQQWRRQPTLRTY